MYTEENIKEAIVELNSFFGKNPEREYCYVSLFGFDNVKIHANSVEQDVRDCADLANK